MKIAIEGCCHGELDDIYGSIKLLEQRDNCKIDLVLICGDFQAVRNKGDLECMSVPLKYRALGTFWKYYAGLVKAPYPTIFIGGNHEASNYLWELYHGGWVCENIYYLGNAGVINYNGIRIGGLSGIYNKAHYDKGHYETLPYSPSHIKSIYHVREYDVQKLLQIQKPMDIFLSHDWPRGVERYGDLNSLLLAKKYFYQEVLSNTLGSLPNEQLLTHLKPNYWFAAHLHVKYSAYVNHNEWKKGIYSGMVNSILNAQHTSMATTQLSNPDEIVIDDDEDNQQNPDEILINEEDNNSNAEIEKSKEDPNANVTTTINTNEVTRFLSLDKCLPRRQFLQVIDIPSKNEDGFTYDLEWLAITRAMHPYLSLDYHSTPLPPPQQLQQMIQKEKDNLKQKPSDLKIPTNFEIVGATHDPQVPYLSREVLLEYQTPISNPQTQTFCDLIDIENKININNTQPSLKHSNQQGNIDQSSIHNDTPNKKLKIDE